MVLTVSKDRNDGVGHTLAQKLNVNIPIVFVSLSENLNFNEEILTLKGKPYCLISYVEMGYNWDRKVGHQFGKNTDQFPNVFHMDSWKVFDDFVRDNPPTISFYRELLQEQVTDKILPISYPCFIPPIPIQSKEEFNNRVFEVFYSFGVSHEYRKDLMGQFWQMSGKYGYSLADNLFLLEHFIANETNPKKWASIHIPWWARQPMDVIMERNGSAKISISIAGAGRGCFRHCESPVNSVMLMWSDNMAWHKDIWEHGVNCLKCEQGKEIETAIEWLSKTDELYEIYVKGVEKVDFFRLNNFVPFLEKKINDATN